VAEVEEEMDDVVDGELFSPSCFLVPLLLAIYLRG
jgi:hypothetical protein